MPETEFHTDLTVGEILRRSRVKYNITFDQAERDLRIKAEHLEALEHNSVERLPGRVYVFGYVRTYSEYLGLDGEKMVQLLKKQAGRKVEKVKARLTMPIEDEDEQKTPGFPVVGASAIGLIIALIAIGTSAPDTTNVIPPVPKQLVAQQTALQKPVDDPAGADAVVSTSGEDVAAVAPEPVVAHPVVLKAIQGTWLEIRNTQKAVVFSRVLNPGEEYWVPEDQTDLYMTLGNAGGLQIIVNGEPIPLLGAVGQVKRNVSLNVQSLNQILTKKPKR